MLRARLLVLATSSLACTISTEPPAHVRSGERPSPAPFDEPSRPEPAPTAPMQQEQPARGETGRREPPDARPLPAPIAGTPADIRVSSPGNGTKRSLRVAPALGAEARLTTTVRGKMTFSGDGKKIAELVLPPVTATWKATVTSVAPDGSRAIDLAIEDASYEEGEADQRTVKATARAVESIRRIRTSFILDPSGTPGPMKTRMDPRALNDLRPSVEAMLMVVPLLFVPAPEAELGAGATWDASSTLAFAEMSLRQDAQYRVSSHTAERSELAVTVKDTMPSPVAVVPGSRQVTALDAELQGSITVEAGRLLPTGIATKVHAVEKSQASADGGPMAVELVLDVEIEGKPPA